MSPRIFIGAPPTSQPGAHLSKSPGRAHARAFSERVGLDACLIHIPCLPLTATSQWVYLTKCYIENLTPHLYEGFKELLCAI